MAKHKVGGSKLKLIKPETTQDLWDNMLTVFRNLGCNMSIKVHYLF